MAKSTDKKLGWHFLNESMKLGYGDGRLVEVGKTLSMKGAGAPRTCHTGMHASERPAHAMSFGKGPVLCRVEVRGDIAIAGEKFCGRSRRVIWARKLSLADLTDLCSHVGRPVSVLESQMVATLANLSENAQRKADAWLDKWARRNGWSDAATAQAQKAPVTEATMRSLLAPALVRSEKAIRESLGPAFDLDGLAAALDAMVRNGKVLKVDNFTRNGLPGYLLGVRH